jgi:hypothetical protein
LSWGVAQKFVRSLTFLRWVVQLLKQFYIVRKQASLGRALQVPEHSFSRTGHEHEVISAQHFRTPIIQIEVAADGWVVCVFPRARAQCFAKTIRNHALPAST